MGWGAGNIGGGSGGGLNFKVVGNPQPVNPKENTIWLNTDVKITGYSFAAEQPEMQPGEAWISTGMASPVAFDALKKNTVMVYPLSAMQMMEDGTLVDVPAKIYLGGAWQDWALYLKPSERAYKTYKWDNGQISVSGDTISYGYSDTAYSETLFVFTDPVDVSMYNTLEATFSVTASSGAKTRLAVTTSLPTNYVTIGQLSGVVAQSVVPNSTGTHQISVPIADVNLNVYVVIYGASNKGTVTNIRMK